MEEFIENISYLIKTSKVSKSDKIIIQLFIEVCLYKNFITIGSKHVTLTKNTAEYFLNNKNNFGSFGRETVIDHRPINNKKIFYIRSILNKYKTNLKNFYYRFLSINNIIINI